MNVYFSFVLMVFDPGQTSTRGQRTRRICRNTTTKNASSLMYAGRHTLAHGIADAACAARQPWYLRSRHFSTTTLAVKQRLVCLSLCPVFIIDSAFEITTDERAKKNCPFTDLQRARRRVPIENQRGGKCINTNSASGRWWAPTVLLALCPDDVNLECRWLETSPPSAV